MTAIRNFSIEKNKGGLFHKLSYLFRLTAFDFSAFKSVHLIKSTYTLSVGRLMSVNLHSKHSLDLISRYQKTGHASALLRSFRSVIQSSRFSPLSLVNSAHYTMRLTIMSLYSVHPY